MKNTKILTAALAAMLILAGCGSSDSSSEKSSKKKTTETTIVTKEVNEDELSDGSDDVKSVFNDDDNYDDDTDDDDDDDDDDTPVKKAPAADEGVVYHDSDNWGESGIMYELPEMLWENDLPDISKSLSEQYGGTVGSDRPVDVFRNSDIWYVSSAFVQDGYNQVADNEEAFYTAYSFIENIIKYAYADYYGLDYDSLAEDYVKINIIEEEDDEAYYSDEKIPPYASDKNAHYTWLSKKIKVTAIGREGELIYFLEGGFVKADEVVTETSKNVPMFVFSFSLDEDNRELLKAFVSHAFNTMKTNN